MSYEDVAERAKGEFVEALRSCRAASTESGEIKVNELARRLGMSNATVSKFIHTPRRISENFIRQVAVKVPGMESCYAQYRLQVDRGYVPADLYAGGVQALSHALTAAEAFKRFEAAVAELRREVVGLGG